MDKLLIFGGTPLKGSVTIGGAKNSALPIMASTLLAQGQHILKRIPKLRDVYTMAELLRRMGAQVSIENNKCFIDTEKICNFEASYDLVKTMRASILVLGPLLARFGKAKVSLPGGCAIGARPVNLHIKGLEKMGAKIELKEGYIIAKANRLKGTKIYFDIPTVTGTENLMMAATLAKGLTIIENAAKEPEVVDLANYLLAMGAKIKGAGTSNIEIEGLETLNPPPHYEIIPDRIEAGTFMAIAGACGSEILLKGCKIEHLEAIILKMKDAGIEVIETEEGLKVKGPKRPRPVDIKTMPYPGFPTDMQAQFMAMMSIASGTSVIKETIFENRFMHVAELRRMGADISVEGNTATVKGVKKLKGAPVMATDLRASASLVIAALIAEGETIIDRIYHLDRGYESLDEKLISLGAKIKRIK
ncbi:MAG: UDP-N-acetylglucosamine 1-carboxyvinyltransferase [Thermodesulfovibrio sp.]|uniref:UDP-N-acetylglucosamine 1-carboxyvinyltransferase n=1 Tax=unclassified Thermodesulfovibrio TaxID=2645936 RepID=UPI00083B35A4|nr:MULTISPECIES: UDP-N-acetylglucosamine 1-carboxyvinyltransferase [unclassified Thermodesulfovibrio]MDI1472327.1 UDP-N-acetylglucosamine 1-carboxyvinyltransferase [Thermodesulfovibrio sp. 1176]MDI6714192.1 UDP-N-acetylglucosamine 1-carboxyvinyltransferase [Thermodesulfovibrio sp.]ODA43511.1 UDP-N-acetylglucosamine 1-carboxyvinyltransferase [Thermodesulfovibrio sp. N1]